MKVVIACGAGASSTFTALRLRRAAAAAGVDLEVSATADSELPALLADVDLVLLGAHLDGRLDSIRAQARDHGTLVHLLPESVFTDTTGSTVLDIVQHLTSTATHPPHKG